MLYALPIALITLSCFAMDLYQESLAYNQMLRENPSVSQKNSLGSRTIINASRFIDTPQIFCMEALCGTPVSRSTALVQYINNQELKLYGRALPKNHPMVKVFHERQNDEAQVYTIERASTWEEEQALASGCGILALLAPNPLTGSISTACALFWCASSEQ